MSAGKVSRWDARDEYLSVDGEFVLYENYAKLETELQDTKRALGLLEQHHYFFAFYQKQVDIFMDRARRDRLKEERK